VKSNLIKPKNKIIIRNYTDMEDFEVLCYVEMVVRGGKVSKTGKGDQYCFHTTFDGGIEVSVIKSGKDTETFYVYKGVIREWKE